MDVKLEWDEVVEYPKFSRTGVCSNKMDIERLENIYKIGNHGIMSQVDRDIFLAKMETLKALRDANVRNIFPAVAEAIKVQEFAVFIYDKSKEMVEFLRIVANCCQEAPSYESCRICNN
ncbi:unnamed protein product [Allacma fusca]|uniref:Uncharacterized protein n=1 Tax=Allacma fusca TaxID=39272 RepID=A0A8J2P2S4_9HEXA|nr:unnamed protein product [Allacma fusca]